MANLNEFFLLVYMTRPVSDTPGSEPLIPQIPSIAAKKFLQSLFSNTSEPVPKPASSTTAKKPDTRPAAKTVQRPTGAVATPIKCPQKFVPKVFADGKQMCLYFSTKRAKFDKAKKDCASRYNSHLFTPRNDLQFNVLKDVKKDSWVGLDDNDEEGKFRWHDDKSILNTEDFNQNIWALDQPDNEEGIEHCIHYWPIRKGLNDRPCSSKQYYICELKI
ncbi:C-type lectin domain 4 member F [Bulinus truncatus]|nr:C-type lectin domain 4 member F [Bulinus truncatus]